MKVLERRRKPTAIVNCPHCGSKLEIDSSDIFWHMLSVTCAICHKGFDVDGYKSINKLF